MTWLYVTGVTGVAALMVWAEWRGLERANKKERMALIAVAATGWIVAVLVLVFPNMPGPIEFFNSLLKPLTSGAR